MKDSEMRAQIDAARAYEALFVPALFQEWAPIIADIAQIKPGYRVLDVACGTGVLTREAAARVGPTGAAVGLDIGPGMLEVAKSIAPELEWKQGSAVSLPFPDYSFDAVVSQFGLMFFPDRVEALHEMRRVLVPGGHLAVAVWDSIGNNPAYAAEATLFEQMAGKEAADAVRVPYVLGNIRELSRLIQSADLPNSTITTHQGTARFPDIRTFVEADLRGWLPVMGVFLEEDLIEDILTEADLVLGQYVNDQYQAEFPVSAHIIRCESHFSK